MIENSEKKGSVSNGTIFRLFAAFIANLMAISDGMTVGWTSPMIPYFLSDKSHIKITQNQAEWLETWLLMGAIIGLPLTIFFVDKIGRKKSLLLASFSLLVAWIIIAFAQNIETIYVARVISGIGGDMAFVAAPMYIAEMADQKIRGFLSSIIYLMMLTGVLTVYIVGPYLPFYVPSLIGVILLSIELIVFSWLPETPYYLLLNNSNEKAKMSLQKFRSAGSVEKELAEISLAVERQKAERARPQDILLVRSYRKAMLIMAMLNAAQQLSSINVILMNMHQVLEEAGSIYVAPPIAAIMFAGLMFIAAAFASVTIDRFGRKKLIMSSSILTGFCLLSLAVYFNIKNAGWEYKSLSWIPIVSVMTYAAVFKVGLGMVPIVITAEIFASKMKALGMAIADGIYVATAMISIYLFNLLRENFGMHVPFYLFASCSFTTSLLVLFYVPETRGKTLDQIQLLLEGK
nr:facilitated trehalose transporter Tret1-like isoform X2 [Leptinotarsa decemlineata]